MRTVFLIPVCEHTNIIQRKGGKREHVGLYLVCVFDRIEAVNTVYGLGECVLECTALDVDNNRFDVLVAHAELASHREDVLVEYTGIRVFACFFEPEFVDFIVPHFVC